MGFVGVHADSFLHCVASPFPPFVTFCNVENEPCMLFLLHNVNGKWKRVDAIE